MEEENQSFVGKVTKCNYCAKEMSFFVIMNHEDKCRKIKKICDGYGNCQNVGVFIMVQDGKKYRWCFDCLKRFKEENPQIKFDATGGLLPSKEEDLINVKTNSQNQ